jgi:hypothetical protein
MYEIEHHRMQLEQRHPSGAEEWFCPTCGRRFLVQWPPTYTMVVLDPGDEEARHSGSSHSDSGLRLGSPQVTPVEEDALLEERRPDLSELPNAIPVESEEASLTDGLRPWLKWFKDIGFADEHDGDA